MMGIDGVWTDPKVSVWDWVVAILFIWAAWPVWFWRKDAVCVTCQDQMYSPWKGQERQPPPYRLGWRCIVKRHSLAKR